MTASALKYTPPKRRPTDTSRHSSRSYREMRYKHTIEEQIGVLNLLRRYSYPAFTESIAKNKDELIRAKNDNNKQNTMQFWILWGSVLQIPKGLTEFLSSLNENYVISDSTGARVAAFLNVLGLVILLYPTIIVCNSYLSEVYKSYKRGFRQLHGNKISWFNLTSRATWHTVREISFARSDEAVKPQSGKDWIMEVMHNISNPPLPIRDPKIPAGMWKRLHGLTNQEYEQTLQKPDMTSLFSSSTSSEETYGHLSV